MSLKLKLFTVLNGVGWLVVVPILAGALLDPFVDFRGWPGGSLFDDKSRNGVQLAHVAPDDPRRGAPATAPKRAAAPAAPAPASVPATGVTVVLPGGAITIPSGSTGTAGSRAPEARPGLQNRVAVNVNSNVIARRPPSRPLRDSVSFGAGRAPGAASAPPATPPPAQAPAAPATPIAAPVPAGNGNGNGIGGGPPVRAVDRPVPETPAPPTKGSGGAATEEKPADEEPNAAPTAPPSAEPDPPVTSPEPPVEAPETPAPPDKDAGSGATPPPPAPVPPPPGDDGNADRAVQPPKHDDPGDDDDDDDDDRRGKDKRGDG